MPLDIIEPAPLANYVCQVHPGPWPLGQYAIEVRPRAGTWAPFFAAAPVADYRRTAERALPLQLLRGAPGWPPVNAGELTGTGHGLSRGGQWWYSYAQEEATPTQSYYIFCATLPSTLIFGVFGGTLRYQVPIVMPPS
jgi:hypothetical protein